MTYASDIKSSKSSSLSFISVATTHEAFYNNGLNLGPHLRCPSLSLLFGTLLGTRGVSGFFVTGISPKGASGLGIIAGKYGVLVYGI
jgi:hypothetical protein